jgi:hypothetical protein
MGRTGLATRPDGSGEASYKVRLLCLLAVGLLSLLPVGVRAGETTVRLTLQPMAAPRPALKYRLLPEVSELKHGNPVQWYLRCFAEQRIFFFNKQVAAERARYQTLPLKELPADQLATYGGSALTQADYGARLDTPDWQVLDRVQTEGTSLRLPDLGPLRILGEGLRVRFRGALARRNYDDAVRTAKTLFALSRHLGEHPTVAANLLGLSIAEMGVDTLEEMVQQPGCPNLYWALTDLPCPLVELRKGIQGDCGLMATELSGLREDTAMTQAQVEELVARLSGQLGFAREQAGEAPRSLRTRLAERLRDLDRISTLRGRMVAAGKPALQVVRMPAAQVVLLDEKHTYEVKRDEEAKLLGLAPWQIDLVRSESGPRNGDGLFADILPRVVELRQMRGRLEQRIALLRHVEALRMYAAEHAGKLPDQLGDMRIPLPNDPFSGKPFVYQIEGATVHLQGSAPRGEEKNPLYNLRYQAVFSK